MPEHSRIAVALSEALIPVLFSPRVGETTLPESGAPGRERIRQMIAKAIDDRLADTREHYKPVQLARCAFVTHHPAGPCAECVTAAMRDFILLPEQLAAPTAAIVCTKYEPGWGPCGFCGKPANKLCDFPTGNGDKTCDARCCKDCATSVGPNKDYCPIHKGKI